MTRGLLRHRKLSSPHHPLSQTGQCHRRRPWNLHWWCPRPQQDRTGRGPSSPLEGCTEKETLNLHTSKGSIMQTIADSQGLQVVHHTSEDGEVDHHSSWKTISTARQT